MTYNLRTLTMELNVNEKTARRMTRLYLGMTEKQNGKPLQVSEEQKDYLVSILKNKKARIVYKKEEENKEKEEERKKTEKEIVGMWIDVCKRAAAREQCYFNCWRIESGDTQIGLPDLFVQVDNMCIWLECKSRAKREHQFHFQPMQLRNLHNLFVHGTASGVLLFDEPLMQTRIVSAHLFNSLNISVIRKNFGADLPDWFTQLKQYVSSYYQNKHIFIERAKESGKEF